MVTRTVRVPLTGLSRRKKQRLERTVGRQQKIAQAIAGLMPSVQPVRWQYPRRDPVFSRWVKKRFPENNGLRSHDANQVAFKVVQNFRAWRASGYGEHPPEYEEMRWMRFCNCSTGLTYKEADGVWGVKLPLAPRDGEWFRLGTGQYQEQILERYRAEEVLFGEAEVIQEAGRYVLHQSYTPKKTPSTGYEPVTVVGVAFGVDNIAAVAVVEAGEIQEVDLFSGDKIRHHRTRMRQRRQDLQRANQMEKVRALGGEEHRYCAQQTHRISRRIIECAQRWPDPVIVMEPAAEARVRIRTQCRHRDDPQAGLADWAYTGLQSTIAYKAEDAGIQTEKVTVPALDTTCNKCGATGEYPAAGNWKEFQCPDCEYTVNADVNRALALATTPSQ
ncbi:transposase [Natronococcus sp. A-GB1]|uniref:transposase n=1 Tax=Natronococcus sp. A-GB1 TaxID=3037648 RepID=UPI00241CB3E5|nr:transposase [Natronococcus sp. A-GB1]MDG5761318.1 transposase [Natronococcus sp. A-GB1]